MIHEPALRHPCPLCCLPPMPRDGTFLRRCKRGVLQFVILKPVTAALSAVMLSAGLYVAVAVLLLLLLLYCRRHGSARHSLHLLPRYRSPGYQNFLLVAYVCRRPAAAAAASTTNARPSPAPSPPQTGRRPCRGRSHAVFALRRSSALTPSPGTTRRTLSRCTSCSSSTSVPRRCSPAGPRWPSSRPSSSSSSPRTWRLRCCCCYYCYCYCYYYYAQGLRLLCPPRLHYYYHYYYCCCCYY